MGCVFSAQNKVVCSVGVAERLRRMKYCAVLLQTAASTAVLLQHGALVVLRRVAETEPCCAAVLHSVARVLASISVHQCTHEHLYRAGMYPVHT